jgi:fructose 1,6-bisphosphate aldolase/phosphatase
MAERLKLYGADQDLLSDAFAGTVREMGPGVAETAFEERPSEPVVVFMADKTSMRSKRRLSQSPEGEAKTMYRGS